VRISIRWALAIAVTSLALWPAAADATRLDSRSDGVSLHAYHAYLQNLLSIGPAWGSADDAYLTSISSQCPHVLGALKHARPGTFSQSALVTFGIEAGGDLDAVAYPLAQPALAQLTSTLGGLHWSGTGTKTAIRRYLSAEASLLHLTPSNLCSDGRALAASHGRHAPHGTLMWVRRFAHRASVAAEDGTTFLTILQRLATPPQRGAVKGIDRLLSRFDASVERRSVAVGQKLLTILGI
jgi:hypothetical protein